MPRTYRFAALAGFLSIGLGASAQSQTTRPMTFLDVQQMRTIASTAPSPDGKLKLYTSATPDWQEAKRQTDIHLVSLQQGLPSGRQLTFTKEKNETSPQWAADGSFFAFLSNRDAPESAATRSQIYAMRVDGGEARRITDAKEGVSEFSFSRDGKWIVYKSGKPGEEQLYRLSIAAMDDAKPEQLTKPSTGVGTFRLSPDSKRVYFISPDSVDPDEKLRREKKFTVNIRNAETPTASLWTVNMDGAPSAARLTQDAGYSVTGITISPDSKWVGIQGGSTKRYERNITASNLYADLFLLDTSSGSVERLTTNVEVAESAVSFSPD